MGHKNDYSIVVYFPDGTPKNPKKWTFVHTLKGTVLFLDKDHPTWLYMNVYNRRTRAYIKRFYKGNSVPDFL